MGIQRETDQRAGFHSPRFWATKDGMAPRRASSFNKDMRQIALEMARKSGAQQFPNTVQKTWWGESRVQWEDMPEADLSKLDGSVMSRSRIFSDVCTNTALETSNRMRRERQMRVEKFPKDVRVFSKALAMRESLRHGMHSLPELR